MSSEDIAKYLNEVGSNERRLEYCRQILASNTNFIPQCLFNLRDPMNTNTQTKSQFISNIQTLGLGCNAQEQALIFNYFQIDGKNYITFSQFSDLILPRSDTALTKVISMRRKEQFQLDYSLKYCLQKYFFQVIESQVKLQLMCKFTFPKQQPKKLKNKRLDVNSLSDFMKAHGKYPDSKICQFIVRQMGLNKGSCKRHKLISEYILDFNEKYIKNQPLPEVIAKEPVSLAETSRKQNLNKENQQRNNVALDKKTEISENKPASNPLLAHPPLGTLATSSYVQPKNLKRLSNPLDSISEVQNRINSLMSEVNLTHKNSSPIREMFKKNSGRQQMKGSLVESIKDQVKREKMIKTDSRVSKNQPKYQQSGNIFSEVKKQNQREEKIVTDRISESKQDFDYEAITEKNNTARGVDSRNKQETSFSQLVYQSKVKANPDVSSSPGGKKESASVKRYDYQLGDRSKRQEDPSKKRIQYLRSLVENRENSKLGK